MASLQTKSSFIDRLEGATEQAPGRRKSERTFARIRLATANCLERTGYLDFKTIDITNEAGLAEGSFYVYFKDKREAAVSVLSEFLEMGIGASKERTRTMTAFEAIRSTNRVWIRAAVEHPGLTRSVFQMVDSDKEFAAKYTEYNRKWHEGVAASVLKRYPSDFQTSFNSVLFATVSLGAMMDEVVRGIFVTGTYAHLQELANGDKSGDKLADALSVIWYRTLYPGAEVPQDRRRQPYLMSELDGQLADVGILSKSKT